MNKTLKVTALILIIMLVGAGAVFYTKKNSIANFIQTSINKPETAVHTEKAKKEHTSTSISSTLLQIEDLAGSSGMSDAEFKQVLENRGFDADAQRRILVEIIGPTGGGPVSEPLIRKFGGELTNSWRHRTAARIPISQLSNFAEALPEGYFVEPVYPPRLDSSD